MDPGVPKMVYTLDIRNLLAAGSGTTCSINQISEVYSGGAQPDCPRLVSALPLPDGTTGGPHWGTLDNFRRNADGTYAETTEVSRISVSNYFVARSPADGNHKVCMINVDATAHMTLDTTFRDENEGTPCIDFNRTAWPHGRTGDAKPHSELFVVKNGRFGPSDAGQASVKSGAPAPVSKPLRSRDAGAPAGTAAPAGPAGPAAPAGTPAGTTPPDPVGDLLNPLLKGIGLR